MHTNLGGKWRGDKELKPLTPPSWFQFGVTLWKDIQEKSTKNIVLTSDLAII